MLKLMTNAWYYISGNVRSYLYYNNLFFLLSENTIFQFLFRLQVMDKKCYDTGQCYCSCSVPEMQFSNKRCEKDCYPPFMSHNNFVKFQSGESIIINNIKWTYENGKVRREELG
jgi:hypothetical protein